MSSALPPDTTIMPELDAAEQLPARHQRSFIALVVVQALNAFNDNFVKILLVAFAGVVAKGTELGTSMQIYLGAIFALPYVLFAPLAGWLSDRFSKKVVIVWMQVAQVMIFGLFLGAILLHQAQLSLVLSLACFFLLAAQSAFFSPAKLGVAKELVGSRRLGSASGTLQLTNFMGILSGMGLAGWWFAARLQSGEDGWTAVWVPMVAATIGAVIQIPGAMLIQQTSSHPELKFHRGILWEHFSHIKLLFSQRPLWLAAMGICFFWFVSNAVGSILFTLSHELHPNDDVGASRELSMMPAMLGIGVMIGSLLAGLVCRRRIELGIVPLSGFALALSLLFSGIVPVPPLIYFGLIAIGIAGGVFMTPLYAFVQDKAHPDERARVMSAINLLDCLSAIVANLVVVKTMLVLKLPAAVQLLVLVPLTLAAAVYITKLLPRGMLYIIGTLLVRTFYRVKIHHDERQPATGPLLLVPNHTSYVDVLIMGASCNSDVRYVMFDSLYRTKGAQWAFDLFRTVPISPARAKEGIRTVAAALKEGSTVCLFPEGQITRTGMLNEINRGFELMARLGGDVKVQPVWLDALWGSMASFKGGLFFKKWPEGFPYKTSVWFGHPIDPKEATTQRVQEELFALSAEAFAARPSSKKKLKLKTRDGAVLDEQVSRMAQMNALRIVETSLLHAGDYLLCLLQPEHPVARAFGLALPALRKVKVCWTANELPAVEREKAILVGDTAALSAIDPQTGSWRVAVIEVSQMEEAATVTDPKTGPALFDAQSGALLTISVPHPPMPAGEEHLQVGHRAGSAGHLLPGLSLRTEGHSLRVGGLVPGLQLAVKIEDSRCDEQGFLWRTP